MPQCRRPRRARGRATVLAGLAFAVIAALPAAGAGAAAPKVVASILPIHALVAGVMAGIGQPVLLVRPAASPHDRALRPSEARALAGADIVFWVGPDLERFLARPLAVLAARADIVTLAEAPGVRLLARRRGGIWNGGGAGGGAATAGRDMHIWLSPDNARAIVRAAMRALARRDPANEAAYRANADDMARRIAALDAALGARLAPVRRLPYFVFHDAFQYFENHFHLAAAGALTADPARRPGIRRLAAIRRRIAQSGVRCVFAEPQFAPGLVRAVTAGTAAKAAVLDPLGADLAPGAEAWFALMRRLAGTLGACLGGDG